MLKYECDICHEIKDPVDVYGPEVFQRDNASLSWTTEKQYMWSRFEADYGLLITPAGAGESGYGYNGRGTICGSCLGDLLVEMIKEIWPSKIDQTPTTQPFKNLMCRCGHSWSRHPYNGPCTSSDPDDTCRKFEEANEDTPADNRTDSDMPEVRAEPEVSEPGPDDSSSLCTCDWQGENFIENPACPVHSVG